MDDEQKIALSRTYNSHDKSVSRGRKQRPAGPRPIGRHSYRKIFDLSQLFSSSNDHFLSLPYCVFIAFHSKQGERQTRIHCLISISSILAIVLPCAHTLLRGHFYFSKKIPFDAINLIAFFPF